MKPQRLDLYYHIVWQGRWHVGSGFQSATADRLVRRMSGAPFVPGSQIKGVLRHQCERLAQALELEAVDPHAGNQEREVQLVKHFTPLAKSGLVVDRLFGSRYQGECLFVTNATPEAMVSTVSLQTRTAMDRVTGTVMEQHLFTTELAEGDICLKGSIRARHKPGILTQDGGGFPYEYALLLASLLSLNVLGGDKSAGLGRCAIKFVDDSLRWNGEVISLTMALHSFQEMGKDWKEMIALLREETP